MLSDLSPQQKQKLIFFIIISAAVIIIAFILAFGQFVARRLGPPDLEATTTTLAIRATQLAIEATEVALTDQKNDIAQQLSSQNLTWNGLQIEILEVNYNAWPQVKAQNQFNDPPLENKRMLMVTLKITNVAGKAEEYIQIGESDFQVIGNERVIYDTYGSDTRCGVVPAALDGVAAPGDSIIGNICVQVPLQESGFVLIYDEYSGDKPAVYFSLPDNVQ